MNNLDVILLLAFFFFICCAIYRIASPVGNDIFSPFYLVTLLYVIVFVLGPLYYILRGMNTVEGLSVFDYLPEATLAFTVGYFFYFCGTFLGDKSLLSLKMNNKIERSYELDELSYYAPGIVRYAWLVYIFGMICGFLYYRSTGRSIAMMLSFGQLGTGTETTKIIGGVGFLVYFFDLPIASLMLLIKYGKKRLLIWIAVIVYVIVTITAGFRYLPMCFGLAFITERYLCKEKRPSIFQTIVAIIVAFCFVGIIGIFRSAMKVGGTIELSDVNFEAVLNSFRFNSDIFYPFYCLVHSMNDGTVVCHMGKGILYIAIMMIPRAIWTSKPTSFGMTAFEAMWGSSMGGAAYPNVGEFYYEFGFIGMIICMFIFGLWIQRRFKMTLYSNPNSIDIISYAILYGYMLQFVNRGYIAGWFYDLLFFLLPIWGLRIYLRIKRNRI